MTSDVDRARRRRRRLRQIALICFLLVLLLAALLTRGQYSVRSLLGLDAPGDTLTLYALSTLNFVAFVVLALVLVRHFLKLARERRERRLGSHFKTRMVAGAIALTLLPTAMLFVFSFWLINTSIKEVFLRPAEQIVGSTQAVLSQYENLEISRLRVLGRTLISNYRLRSERAAGRSAFVGELEAEVERARISTLIVRVAGETARIEGPDSNPGPLYRRHLDAGVEAVLRGDRYGEVVRTSGGGTSFAVVGIPIARSSAGGGLVLARRLDPDLSAQFATIAEQQQELQRLLAQQNEIRFRYVFTLSFLTLVLLFVTVWIALYVSRSVTEPIQALAEATGQVAGGNLEHRITYEADGELATLIASFNAMAAQLGESRARLVEAAIELKDSNLALDERRAYIETVLAGLSTGVLSVDAEGRLTTANPAAVTMLGLGPEPPEGADLAGLVGPVAGEIEPLFRRARRGGMASAELEVRRPDGTEWPASVSVSALTDAAGAYSGAVVTIEDLSELIRAERAAAWSEVARRMAHEIKNPLTPIQLSAERIARSLKREGAQGNGRYAALVEECTTTIIHEVGALQHMVEEFSRFARLPQSRPVTTDLNEVVRTAAGLYRDRLDGVTLEVDLAPALPPLQLDPEQMKRVAVNLIDNALEAVSGRDERRVTLSTRHDARDDVVRLVVDDTGHGIGPAARDRLFLPYFSTRTRGTGLGLAIVSHIIADHRGTIRAEERPGGGARFIIELPVVP